MKKLIEIQNELKCPKGNFNSFGKYKYRSAEQILEALKPVLLKHEASLILTDSIEPIGTKLFLKATAICNIEGVDVTTYGYAELSEHKGMSAEQCTGTASSYARKYALNGLFLIDETESDPDSKDNSKDDGMDLWKQQINGCKSLDDLTALYDANKPLNSAVMALFTTRKLQLNAK